MKIGDIIKQYRKEHGYSMDVFSEKSGLSKSYISMLEANKDSRGNEIAPSVETIAKVAEGMNISFEELFNKLDYNQKVRVNSVDGPRNDYYLPEYDALIEAYSRHSDLEYLKKYIELLRKQKVKRIIECLGSCDREQFDMIYNLADAILARNEYLKFKDSYNANNKKHKEEDSL